MEKSIRVKQMKDIYDNQLFQIQAAMFIVSLTAFAVSLLFTLTETEDKGLVELAHQTSDIGFMLLFFIVLVHYVKTMITYIIP